MKRIIKNNPSFLIIGIIFVLTLILYLLKINTISFFLLSIITNIILIKIIYEIVKYNKIKFTKKQKLFILLFILLIYLFYIISLIFRKFIYYWDYACYYNIQIYTKEYFENSLFQGIKYFISSTWSGEYGNFLTFFPQIIFQFIKNTPNNYVLSCVLVFVPYIIISLSILIKKVINILKIKNENIFFFSTLLIFSIFPLVHATFIYGQPDIFGIVFIFLIITLTIDYNFKEIDKLRLILLFLVTYMLIITRRWYLYWILSYFICYIIKIVIENKKNIKVILKNIIIYGLIVSVLILGTLFPLIKNIIFSDYGDRYSFYLSGGLKIEFLNQISHLGLLFTIIILISIIIGLIKKKLRTNTILNIVQYILIIFLFTKIQNMGLHHSITLITIYLYFVFQILYYFNNIKIKTKIIYLVLITISITNFIICLTKVNTNLTSDIDLIVENEVNYNQLENVADWLKENINENSTAYMITHNNMFNPDKLRNIYMPDKSISNYLPYGSAIIGVHKFPTELFTAKYIITTTPFDITSIEYKYNDVFNELVYEGVFKEIKTFNMKNNYKMIIYERVEEVSIDEVNKYKDILEEESNKYPDLYSDIIDSYLQNKSY